MGHSANVYGYIFDAKIKIYIYFFKFFKNLLPTKTLEYLRDETNTEVLMQSIQRFINKSLVGSIFDYSFFAKSSVSEVDSKSSE